MSYSAAVASAATPDTDVKGRGLRDATPPAPSSLHSSDDTGDDFFEGKWRSIFDKNGR